MNEVSPDLRKKKKGPRMIKRKKDPNASIYGNHDMSMMSGIGIASSTGGSAFPNPSSISMF